MKYFLNLQEGPSAHTPKAAEGIPAQEEGDEM